MTISITAAVTATTIPETRAGTLMVGWGRLIATKTAFYLDPLTRNTGALRLIPGSHHPDHFVRKEKLDVNNSLELFGVPPSELPGSIAVETNPGDIAIFNHDLYHASFGGTARRRMFTMNCTICPEDAQTKKEGVRQYVQYSFPRHWK